MLSRLLATIEEASRGRARLVLVGGEAGIGKTTLIAEAGMRSGLLVGWGTCLDAERTPAFGPWTAALRDLLNHLVPAELESLTRIDRTELARLLPELGEAADEAPDSTPRDGSGDDEAARLRLFDAVARFLERMAAHRPTLVVLDDLQWSDESSLQLLRFLARPYRPVPLVVLGAYRHDELSAETATALGELAAHNEMIQLSGLSPDEVFELVTDAVGPAAAKRWSVDVHRRTDGHPFFARQLSELLADPGRPHGVLPAAARDLVIRRVARLSPGCRALVEAAAVGGNELLPDVLAAVCGIDATTVAEFIEEGLRAGVLARDRDGGRARLAHDLFRETLYAELAVPARLALHQRIADALEDRHGRGIAVVPADLARHTAAAVALDGGARVVRWARAAANAEYARLAFAEAAAHLSRARHALEDAGDGHDSHAQVELLVEEADARARSGSPDTARALLDDAKHRAIALGAAEQLGKIALRVQRLGARFAMPRDAVLEVLETARKALQGTATALEAQLIGSLARELHHSVPAQRMLAPPLSEQAITLARQLGDPDTLAACLLARHDVLWTPGRAGERIELAREITDLAKRAGDVERHAEGLLLTANALLEEGSPAFRAALTDYLYETEGLRQPRHDYMAMTRRAAVALIDGHLDEAEEIIVAASQLGDRIGEPDTGNVRMSQLVGLVRARGEPEALAATAAEAIRWWIGVPSLAHAVAAGLFALAGGPENLAAARRALDTVVALDAWREDRSYMWSVCVGSLATAAVILDDRAMCSELLVELEPRTDACGVNGAVVCFMGSNAHWAGHLAGALGRTEDARRWLSQALAVHQRLGAPGWEAQTQLELAAVEAGAGKEESVTDAELSRDGDLWRLRHHHASAHLRHVKGLTDLVILLSRPGTDVHVLELAGADHRERDSGTMLDANARTAYRRRLAELDEDLDAARSDNDPERVRQLDDERSALISELSRAAGLGGRTRALGSSTTERARKAVTARLRDAISRICAVLPELGTHLDRSVLTGTSCRYEPTQQVTWTLKNTQRGAH